MNPIYILIAAFALLIVWSIGAILAALIKPLIGFILLVLAIALVLVVMRKCL